MLAENLLIALTTIFVALAVELRDVDHDKVVCLPQQVHLSFGDTTSIMVVMWSTVSNCTTEVHYGTTPWGSYGANIVQGNFVRQPVAKVPYIHRVVLVNLEADTTYYYTPVSNLVTSGPFYFKTPKRNQDLQPEFLVYGDLGIHAESLPLLKTEALKGIYTAVLHVGDFGYNLDQYIHKGPYAGENVGDVFMRQIEDMAAHVPYMTAPGNHESDRETFNQYRYRFSMPNSGWPMPLNQMWYSIDVGPVHFLSYSTEVFFTSGGKYVETQKAWIQVDLAAANTNRQRCPWIIVFGHRPLYCSNNDGDDCTKDDSLVRAGFESLFYEYGVDLVLQAHEHSYERIWPMYKGVVLSRNYTNPAAPVQLVTGAAGSKYGVDKMSPIEHPNKYIPKHDWSAFRMDDRSLNSFGRLKVFNSTHLYWEQIGVMDNSVLDSIWVSQTTHGPFQQTVLDEEQKEKISVQIEKEEKIENAKKPPQTGSSDKPSSTLEKVTKAIKGVDTKVIIGVSFAVFVLVFLLIVCIVRLCCRKRQKTFRRWEMLDYGKKFYTNVKNDEKEADDFEADVNDGTTKLLASEVSG